MRYFEDLEVGIPNSTSGYTVGADEIIEFATQYDPMLIHTDVNAAEESEFGGLIASGIHLLAIWRKLDFELTKDIDVVCGMGMDNIRFVRPLYANDMIKNESTVLHKKLSDSRKNCGIVHFRHRVKNHDKKVVSSHTTKVLIRCAPVS